MHSEEGWEDVTLEHCMQQDISHSLMYCIVVKGAASHVYEYEQWSSYTKTSQFVALRAPSHTHTHRVFAWFPQY